MRSIEQYGNNSILQSKNAFIQNSEIKASLRKYVLSQIPTEHAIVCIGGEAYAYGLVSQIKHVTNYTNNKYIYADCDSNAKIYINKKVNNFMIDYNMYEQLYSGDVLIINLAKLNVHLMKHINNRFFKKIIIISCHHDDFWKKTRLLDNYTIKTRKQFLSKLFFVSVSVFEYKREMPTFVSLGSSCAVAYNLRKYGLRNESLPFDWVRINNFTNLNKVFLNDFKDYDKFEVKKLSDNHSHFESGGPSSLQLKNPYNFQFYHEIVTPDEVDSFRLVNQERIMRLKSLQNNRVIFVILNDSKKQFDPSVLNSFFNNFEVKYIDIATWDGDWTYANFDWAGALFSQA